jgi:hypothetical protein
MFNSSFWPSSWFGTPSTQWERIEERVLESLDRCGVSPSEVVVVVHETPQNTYGVRVRVLRDDPLLWIYGPHIESYIKNRLLNRHKIKLVWVTFSQEDGYAFTQISPIFSSSHIAALIKRDGDHLKQMLALKKSDSSQDFFDISAVQVCDQQIPEAYSMPIPPVQIDALV